MASRMIAGQLGVAEHGMSVRESGAARTARCADGQGWACVARVDQDGGAININKDGRVVGLEAESVVAILLRRFDIAAVEFKFPGDEIGGGAELDLALVLRSRDGIGVTFAFLNDLADEVGFVVRLSDGAKVGRPATLAPPRRWGPCLRLRRGRPKTWEWHRSRRQFRVGSD